jgi:hypothetical protein
MGGPPRPPGGGAAPEDAARQAMTRDALIGLLRGQVATAPAGTTTPRPYVPPSETAGQRRPLI